MYKERNTRTNLPAEIELLAGGGEDGAEESTASSFVAKGGGSANKSWFFQPNPSLLRPDKLVPYLEEKNPRFGDSRPARPIISALSSGGRVRSFACGP